MKDMGVVYMIWSASYLQFCYDIVQLGFMENLAYPEQILLLSSTS